ncbi:MAG: hypothetical protein L3J18_08340 [Candidatus Brocadia sp.]|jgi:hypothetical protein|uniref:O-Antigen ligase n=1 Tax=Candidatus Brocadia fulgida TaxID=380242 RepID=A0A0M2V1B3_9BACT|nr:MAG: hypothetical protein BROFUL_00326 [Candidatus Brocadia fulgida]UJS22306.1 MAG: hypothetical protein L3J18_08340 [Candidatus Brocadia sp.]
MNIFAQKNLHTPVVILTILTFAMLPIYLLPSGGFQFVDVIIILLSLATLIAVNVSEIQIGIYLIGPFIPFVSWAVIVNSYYSMETISKGGYFLTLIQLIFGFYIVFLFSIVFNRIFSNPKGVFYLYWSLLVSCITPWLIEAKGGTVRNALSFNNPNQLAYYAILIISMLILINYANTETRNKKAMYWILNIIILIFSNVFVMVSVSRAGLAVIILLDIYLFYKLLGKYKKSFFVPVTMLVVTSIVIMQSDAVFNMKSLNDPTQTQYTQLMTKRFTNYDIKASLYKRILGHVKEQNKFEVILGRGGDKGRFGEISVGDSTTGQEAHNIITEIFDSYGMIGIVLFLGGSIFFFIRLGNFPYKWFFFMSLLLFNMLHNGIRFRCMWVSIALVSIVSFIIYKRQADKYYQLSELQPLNQNCKP